MNINTFKDKCRKIVMRFKRLSLNNHDLTLICNNCIAGCVLHDLGLQFRTPTINLYMPFPDYINFLCNIKEYVSLPLVNAGVSKEGAPCAKLGGVK